MGRLYWKQVDKPVADQDAEKVIVLDNLSSAYAWNISGRGNTEFIRGDILDDVVLKRVFTKTDYAYHLAAYFANQNSVDNPEKDLMVNGWES